MATKLRKNVEVVDLVVCSTSRAYMKGPQPYKVPKWKRVANFGLVDLSRESLLLHVLSLKLLAFIYNKSLSSLYILASIHLLHTSSLQASLKMSADKAESEPSSTPLALPAPSDVTDAQRFDLNAGQMAALKLDNLGPMVVNSDGVSRCIYKITKW